MWPSPVLTPARTFPKSLDCVQAELSTKLVWELQAQAGVGAVPCQLEYQGDGFVEKNRDAVPKELVGLLQASKVRSPRQVLSRQSLAGLWEPGRDWCYRR